MYTSRKQSLKPWAEAMVSALFWLGLWALAYRRVGQDLLLASPGQVVRQLWVLLQSPVGLKAVWASLLRTLTAFGLGVALGSLLAPLAHGVPLLGALLRPALSVIRATPVASFIILALVWLRSDSVPILCGFLMVLPVVFANVSQGLDATDPQLLEMGRAYHFSRWKRLRHIYLPSLAESWREACVTSIGLCWKAVVAAEVLGVPRGAIGTRLYESKIYLQTDGLLAWTAVVVCLSMGLEKLLALLLGRRRGRNGHSA